MQKVFDAPGTFEASWAAEKWCQDHGVSVGYSQAGAPRGLLRGNFIIAKWRNLDRVERALLDGTMTGDGRNGPVTVTLVGEEADYPLIGAPTAADAPAAPNEEKPT